MSTTIAKARELFYQISNENSVFEQKLEHWAKSEVERSEKLYREHNLVISNEEERIQSLHRKYNEICQKVVDLEKTVLKERQLEDEHHQHISQLKNEEMKITKEIPILQQKYDNLKVQGNNIYQQHQTETSVQKQKLQNMNKSSDKIKKYFGLYFQQGENGMLKVCYTNINQKHPEKVFSFSVKIQNSKYEVLDFDPMIKVDEELVQELNRKGDLRNFIISVRSLFVKNYQ
eukprot:gene4392-7767_t